MLGGIGIEPFVLKDRWVRLRCGEDLIKSIVLILVGG